MPDTIQIGISGTPAAVGTAQIETTVSLTGTQIQGTNDYAFIKSNGSSPMFRQVVVSNGANQTITFPSGVVDVMVVPPDGSTSANVVLTDLNIAFPPLWNTPAPFSPTAFSDFCFNNANLPTSIIVRANAANLPLTILGF